jgi:hypothetical protein
LAKRGVLVRDACPIQVSLHIEHGLLGRLKHGVKAAQHRHRQNNVPVFTAYIQITKYIVSNIPYEVRDPAEISVAHSDS